jgi:hypothetical protein
MIGDDDGHGEKIKGGKEWEGWEEWEKWEK